MRAWIEISSVMIPPACRSVALFTRAWIEIVQYHMVCQVFVVALFTRAWIEISVIAAPMTVRVSPSSRGRGLK